VGPPRRRIDPHYFHINLIMLFAKRDMENRPSPKSSKIARAAWFYPIRRRPGAAPTPFFMYILNIQAAVCLQPGTGPRRPQPQGGNTMSGDLETTTELKLDFGPGGAGLIPVVTQDAASKEVLILSYVNKDALAETRRSGLATYYSRSRKQLWKKGETSGNYLKIREIRINCEQNSLLFLVDPPAEGACHAKQSDGTFRYSCYYRSLGSGDSLSFLPER
jgi:phosphoribosyl-AMP cyclohydrolase